MRLKPYKNDNSGHRTPTAVLVTNDGPDTGERRSMVCPKGTLSAGGNPALKKKKERYRGRQAYDLRSDTFHNTLLQLYKGTETYH